MLAPGGALRPCGPLNNPPKKAEAGASLLPLSAALVALALSASAVAARVGLRNTMTGGMALIAIASAVIGIAIAGGGMVLLAIGFFVIGTFLGGSGGVAGGAIAFALGGFVGVLMMIALAGIIGAALSCGISETA